jgi:RND family efflux transporter MFP subunit
MNAKNIFLALNLILLSCAKKIIGPQKHTYKVKSQTVVYSSGEVNRSYPGEIHSTERSVLSFEIPGRVINSNRREGERVKKGEILAQIDVTDYKLNLEKADAKYQSAKAEYDRAKILWASEAISKSEFDSTKAAFISTKSEMEKTAKNFRNTTLRAPYSGIVAKIFVKNFEEVKEKQEIMVFYDPENLDVAIHVPESQIAEMDKNAKRIVTANLMGLPDKKLNLKFKQISSVIDQNTRSYETIFHLENPQNFLLIPGMTVNVNIKFLPGKKSEKKTIFLPAISVLEDNQKKRFVFVIDEKTFTAKKRVVKIGPIKGPDIEILSGLGQGEKIVTAGAYLLHDGDKLELLEETGGL